MSQILLKYRFLLKHPVALLCFAAGILMGMSPCFGMDTDVLDTDTQGESSERHLPMDQQLTPWIHDPMIFYEKEGDRKETHNVMAEDVNTVKLDNLVPPIHFGLGKVDITDEYVALLRKVLDDMRDRANVRLHFIGHADSLRLYGDLKEIYGDNFGLSRERAGTVAEYCQKALGLPPEAISYEGLGDTRPLADNGTEEGRRLNRRVEAQVWYDKVGEKQVEKEVFIPRQVNRIKICRTETVCKLRYKEGHAQRARVKNLLPPLHYDDDHGMADVPESFVRHVKQAMNNLQGKQNVVAKFIAYTDDIPLQGRNERIYGNHLGLSKAVARRVSLAIQEKLELPFSAVDSDGKGAAQSIADNTNAQGRRLNRRVEVEFWYDDPLQDLPDEPQLCPDQGGAETVAREYDASLGSIPPILFEKGKPVIPPGFTDHLRQIMTQNSDKPNVRLRFVGYTGNKRLDRRTAAIYGDDIGLSMARARRALQAVQEQMDLPEDRMEFDGHGYVQSEDVVNTGFVTSDTSRVKVKVIYDELLAVDDYEGVEVTPITREVMTKDPFALNLMRITVDGKPIDDPGKSSCDVQRCTDVALDNADIQFKHDSLKLVPRLNVTAWPRSVRVQDLAGMVTVQFLMYSNYQNFFDRAEVRIFDETQSVRDVPLDVVTVDPDGNALWVPEIAEFSAPVRKLQYVLRVYNNNGLFDETHSQPLWVVDETAPVAAGENPEKELLAGYGESRIALRNIPLHGGTIQAFGAGIPPGHSVWLAGRKVPVDDHGRFVAEEILPEGLHTVEVAVLDENGNGELFLRDLALEESDWFTVGIADVTAAANKTNGPAKLLSPDKPQYSDDFTFQGRLAFYTTGKLRNGWSVTGSADTREGPLDEIFSNFLDKSEDALFRRMDPDYHYPTFGDDSSVVEDAPTSGKFYLKAKKDETYGLWGNFKLNYTDNDLTHVDRTLYGANLHYQPNSTTSFGEPRFLLDGFAADPGTVAGRDEFRGTGGSLYYLRRQDVLEGSEKVRIEIRDKDSGIVLETKSLTPVLDYDIDYLQGRILLSEPLASTADDDMLVSSDSINGNPVFLVVRYEYTPGFDDPDVVAFGGRTHFWFGNYVKVGLTAGQEEQSDIEESISGVDLTLRKSAVTWIKLETGSTDGLVDSTTTSLDGGYNFSTSNSFGDSPVQASANRIDASIGMADLFKNGRGRVTAYRQDIEAGYSAPGMITTKETTKYGGTAQLPITDRIDARAKMDRQIQTQGLQTENTELDLDLRMNDHWTISSGLRHEDREDHSEVVSSTQEEGQRTDAKVQLFYDSRSRWTTYGFAQQTLDSTGTREDNDRYGVGGSIRMSDRFTVNGEISDGDYGTGGKLGTEFLYSDRTTTYLNYTLENDRTDNGLAARKGNLASGFRTRYSDSASVFLEEKYTHGDTPTGLVHSTGVDLAPTDRLNLGATADFGVLKDPDTMARIDRQAVGVSIGYGFDQLKFASAVEYRVDDVEQPESQDYKRTIWLLKNSLKYQVSADWRLIAKYNFSVSENTLGDYYDGDYTEASLGYAYRPVQNDRLNALIKYTYFSNRPVTDQNSTTTGSDIIQRSHIAALDVMYDLTARWTVGGKYAYRHGQVAQDREDPEFFDSRAHLYVLRADWHVIHLWDLLLEGRLLDLPDAQDARAGALVGVYRHVGQHLKVGIGYNFSDFSDDLTQLDYQHQGVFVNLIGKI